MNDRHFLHTALKVHARVLLLSCVTLFLLLATGCHTDPNAKRQKFLEKGNHEFDQRQYSAALIYYGRALQVDPHFAEAHYKLAQTQLKLNNWGPAYLELQRTVELQPENWQAQLELGQLQLAGGKREEAKKTALMILGANAQNADAKILLASAETALGNLPEALRNAQEAVALAPNRATAYLNLGQIQLRNGNTAEAEASLKKAESLDSQSIVPYVTLGAYYERSKRWPEAEREFQAAIQAVPTDPVPRAGLARLYFAQGKVPEAEQVLTDAKNQLSSNPLAYRMLGDSYLTRGLTDKAVTEFGALSAKYHDDLSVRKTYIQLLILNNRLDEATQLDEQILKKSPHDAEALVLRGQIQLRRHNLADAISTLQGALKDSLENATGHYQLGLAFAENGNIAQAETEWREAVRIRPAFHEAWLSLAASAAQRADWRTLEELSDQLKKNAPNVAEGYLYHATARLNQGDATSAEADLIHLQQIAPLSPLYYVKMGELRLVQHRQAESESFFRQALTHDPDSLEAIRGIVQIDLLKNKTVEALKFVHEQTVRSPNSPGLFLLQAELQWHAKQQQQAEESLSRVLDLDSKSTAAYALRAQIQIAQGQTEKAIATYQRAIELAPLDIRLQMALGGLYETLGNWQDAQSTYQKLLAIQPENALASNNLAYLMLEHGGSPTVALTLAQTARKGLPNLPNSADTLGWAYYYNGAFSAAAPLFEEAAKKVPNNQSYHYHLGLTYEKLGDSTRARAELEKVISISPNSALASKAHEVLTDLKGS